MQSQLVLSNYKMFKSNCFHIIYTDINYLTEHFVTDVCSYVWMLAVGDST